jgi:DNA-directed RNA polymerase subunit RPC12/RpoP
MFDYKGHEKIEKVGKNQNQRKVYTAPICSKCKSDQWTQFVDPRKGQGLRCKECLHEKIIVKPAKTFQNRAIFRKRMNESWTKQKARKTF